MRGRFFNDETGAGWARSIWVGTRDAGDGKSSMRRLDRRCTTSLRAQEVSPSVGGSVDFDEGFLEPALGT